MKNRKTQLLVGAIVHHRASQYVAKRFDEVAPAGFLRSGRKDCEACGSREFTPSNFRECDLCGFCIDRWKKLDSIMQEAEGRNATWEEMMKGLHPWVILGKE